MNEKTVVAISLLALVMSLASLSTTFIETDSISMANISTNWDSWISGGGGSAGFPNNGTVDFNGSELQNYTGDNRKVNKTGDYMTGDLTSNYNRLTNFSFAQLFNLGTAGFDIRNTNSIVVNSVAVGTVGNMNLYGNWNSTKNNVSDSTLNAWALRFGVAGSQAERLRFIWVKSNDALPESSVGGNTQYLNVPLEVYQNQSVNFTAPNLVLNGMNTTDPSASTNKYICWDSGTNKTFLKTTGCDV